MTNTEPAGQPAGQAKAPLELIAASLRRERHRSGLSLTEVARRAGIAKSTLSQLESGTGNPSLETLWAICVALDAPFSRLLDPPQPHILLIRADEGPTVSAAEADYQATLLAACPSGARRDVYRIQAEPGHARASEPHMPGVVEHVVIGAGRALGERRRTRNSFGCRSTNRRRRRIVFCMPCKPKPQPDDPAQSKRFINMAREIGADETEKGREAFERAFKKVVPIKPESP